MNVIIKIDDKNNSVKMFDQKSKSLLSVQIGEETLEDKLAALAKVAVLAGYCIVEVSNT